MRWTVLAVALLMIPGVAAQYTTEDVTITSHDDTALNARLYIPETTPAPAILLTHGWNQNIDSTPPITFQERYAEQGYIVLAYDSRGWGGSGGEVELNGPNEVADAKALIDWLAAREDVILDGPGDPRIGMVGQSYAGGIQLLTAQEDDRIDAIAPFATWSNLMHSLAPDDVVKRGWVDLLFASGEAGAHGIPLGSQEPEEYDPNTSGVSPDLARWYATIQTNNGPDDELREEIGEVRSLSPGALNTPTYLVQGWPDTLFTPEDTLMTYDDLRSRGIDVRMAFFDGGHGFGDYTNETVMTHVDDFFAQYLRDDLPTLAPYPVLRYRYAEDDYVGETQWPPMGSTPRVWYIGDDGLTDTAAELEITLNVPPAPAYCTEVSNFQGETGDQCGDGAPGTFHTFATAPFEEAMEVTGAGQVLVPISTTQTEDAFLFFQLLDIAPDGTAETVLAHVKPYRGKDASAFVDLPAVTHTFEEGHSLGLQVSTTDFTYMGSREPGQITLSGAAGSALMFVPMVPKDAHGDGFGPSVTRLTSFQQTLAGSNDTQVLDFELRDNLALGEHTVSGDRADVEVTVVSESVDKRRIQVIATASVCDVGLITVTVEDLAGNNATRDYSVVPCPPVEPEGEDEEPKAKKSPGGWFLVPVLLAALLRRR